MFQGLNLLSARSCRLTPYGAVESISTADPLFRKPCREMKNRVTSRHLTTTRHPETAYLVRRSSPSRNVEDSQRLLRRVLERLSVNPFQDVEVLGQREFNLLDGIYSLLEVILM